MTTTLATPAGPPGNNRPHDPARERPLDDVMIAMDVVDTLRHDQRIAERELNEEGRRAELIERLRALYKSQGIDVPDRILEEGVKALEERRFAYEPPAETWKVRLARLYVTRRRWGRRVGIATAVAVLIAGTWHMTSVRPRQLAARALEREMKVDLPARVDRLARDIASEARRPEIGAEAKALAQAARASAERGESEAARRDADRLARQLAELQRAFEVRIVNRKGEATGLWRIPKTNQAARNYYLVVEALDAEGRVLERDVLNEETGKTERVTRWAQRVPKALFDEILADKRDDGIVQKALLGRKIRGEIEPEWLREVERGALTKW